MSPIITTIITTYCRPQLLKKAISSVLQQTYPHFKVCVYDNASNDETEEVVCELMKQDSRIQYHRHSTNIGMMANYQYALSRIDTPYFSILSDDDYLLPSFYETALKGFEQCPDIAFSACGVKAINENSKFIAAPIHNWERDGYFAPTQGIMKMITHPLLPVAILFNHQLVKNINPDLSPEIQIRWDTDYLLQISSSYPIFLNKKICAFFLAHEQGFSTGKYRQMQESATKLKEYIKITEQMMQRILANPALKSELKTEVKNEFNHQMKKDYYACISLYFERKRMFEAVQAFKMYRKKFKLDAKFILFFVIRWLSSYIPAILIITRKILYYYRYITNKKNQSKLSLR